MKNENIANYGFTVTISYNFGFTVFYFITCFQEVAAIARHLLSGDECPSELSDNLDGFDQQIPTTEPQNNVPSPVKEPDPILSTCTTDWKNEGNNSTLFSVCLFSFLCYSLVKTILKLNTLVTKYILLTFNFAIILNGA